MNRRGFVRSAGLGSLAIASGATLPGVLGSGSAEARPPEAGRTNFVFTAATVAEGVDPTNLQPGDELFIANGSGAFNNAQVQGHGSFNHIQVDNDGPPFTLLAHGTWKARRLREFALNGVFGAHASGTLEMDVGLFPVSGQQLDAVMIVNCNLPPAALFTGLPESIMVNVAGGPTFGFANLLAATLFSVGVEQGAS